MKILSRCTSCFRGMRSHRDVPIAGPMGGRDWLITGPNELSSAICRVCDSEMTVERGIMAPLPTYGALSRRFLQDRFRCPHYRENWHIQAGRIQDEAANSSSATISRLLLRELDHVLSSRTATKEIR